MLSELTFNRAELILRVTVPGMFHITRRGRTELLAVAYVTVAGCPALVFP